MHNLTLVLGILLVCIGLGGYFASHGASVTALIPSFLGIPVILLGFSARRDRWRKRALHVAAALAFLGVIGSARGLANLVGLLLGTELDRPLATISQSLTAALCAAYFILALRSFVNARISAGSDALNDKARHE